MTRSDRLASGTLTDFDRRILSMRGYRVYEYLPAHPFGDFDEAGQAAGFVTGPAWVVEDFLGQRVIRADKLAEMVERLEAQQ